jgi:hypothetical protein
VVWCGVCGVVRCPQLSARRGLRHCAFPQPKRSAEHPQVCGVHLPDEAPADAHGAGQREWRSLCGLQQRRQALAPAGQGSEQQPGAGGRAAVRERQRQLMGTPCIPCAACGAAALAGAGALAPLLDAHSWTTQSAGPPGELHRARHGESPRVCGPPLLRRPASRSHRCRCFTQVRRAAGGGYPLPARCGHDGGGRVREGAGSCAGGPAIDCGSGQQPARRQPSDG